LVVRVRLGRFIGTRLAAMLLDEALSVHILAFPRSGLTWNVSSRVRSPRFILALA
jgi:hypothetical protein